MTFPRNRDDEPAPTARRHPRSRGRPVAGRAVRGLPAGLLRRRGDQGRAARRRRSAAPVARSRRERHLVLVAQPGAQQEVRHGRPAQRRGPRPGRPPGAPLRRADRELPPGRDGKVGLGPGRPVATQSGPGLRPHLGLRAGRPLRRQARLRLGLRGDRRPALRQRPAGRAADAAQPEPGRHDRRPAHRARYRDGLPAPRAQSRQRRAGDRHRAVRGRLQPARGRGPRVRRRRRGA